MDCTWERSCCLYRHKKGRHPVCAARLLQLASILVSWYVFVAKLLLVCARECLLSIGLQLLGLSSGCLNLIPHPTKVGRFWDSRYGNGEREAERLVRIYLDVLRLFKICDVSSERKAWLLFLNNYTNLSYITTNLHALQLPPPI